MNIVSGFKLNIQHPQLNEFLAHVRADMINKQKEIVVTDISKDCASQFDVATLKGYATTKIFDNVINEHISLQADSKKNNTKNTFVDFETQVVIFTQNNDLYGIFYSTRDEFIDMFMAYDQVTDFTFMDDPSRQSFTDADEHAHRKVIWDDIFKDTSYPILAGASYHIILDYQTELPDVSEVIRALPSIQQRVQQISKLLLFREWRDGNASVKMNMIELYEGFNDFIESDVGLSKYTSTSQQYLTKLQLIIARQDISKGLVLV